VAKPSKMVRKSSKEQESLKINTEAQKSKKSSKSTLPLKSTLPNTLNANSPLYIVIYHVFSLNHPVSKEFYQLYAHTLPLWQ
jgi:hypothetical protein